MKIFLVCLLLVTFSQEVEQFYSFDSDLLIIGFAKFGFFKGGTIDLQITISDVDADNFYFFVLNKNNVDDFYSTTEVPFCEKLEKNLDKSDYITQFTNSSISYQETVKSEMYYFFYLANCQNQPKAHYEINYSFLNPGGQQLSSGLVPVPTMCLIFVVLWILVIVYWVQNWIKFRDQKILLHQIISIVLIVMFFSVFFKWAKWDQLSHKGQLSDFFNNLILFIDFLSLFAMTATGLLIASGLSIVHPILEKKHLIYILFLSTSLSVSVLMQEYYQMTSFAFVLFFMSMTFFLIFIRVLFSNLYNNISTLTTHLSLIRNAGITPDTTPTFEKLKMFQSFKLCIIAYLFFFLFFGSMKVVVPYDYSWVSYFFDNFTLLFLSVIIVFIFKRKIIPEFNPIPSLSNEEGNETNLDTQDEENINSSRFEQYFKKPYSKLFQNLSNLQDIELNSIPVIIENPTGEGNHNTNLAYETRIQLAEDPEKSDENSLTDEK
ncbi:hypothetical protein M0813_24298 [Anaeramoeba flamelloides]|uniref:GOST seven transmembrane domain-containing protein n=1 Tax=Anaeramoeba flamelloides TaxID=1746091 RepID=A0AAV7YTW6_9EUKA|nr:hypothetical protein M0812_21285 [Anaeramoeba flamelloides]KAJ6240300.1 hypothetical protein M0813_24298 [Anaeramoeba flamelloides]